MPYFKITDRRDNSWWIVEAFDREGLEAILQSFRWNPQNGRAAYPTLLDHVTVKDITKEVTAL